MILQIGNVVRLTAGGPKMTVDRVQDPPQGIVWCIWFAGNDLREGRFSAAALEIVEQPTAVSKPVFPQKNLPDEDGDFFFPNYDANL
jgi:uncharacterized protein YodC (DUF2158 family)